MISRGLCRVGFDTESSGGGVVVVVGRGVGGGGQLSLITASASCRAHRHQQPTAPTCAPGKSEVVASTEEVLTNLQLLEVTRQLDLLPVQLLLLAQVSGIGCQEESIKASETKAQACLYVEKCWS